LPTRAKSASDAPVRFSACTAAMAALCTASGAWGSSNASRCGVRTPTAIVVSRFVGQRTIDADEPIALRGFDQR